MSLLTALRGLLQLAVLIAISGCSFDRSGLTGTSGDAPIVAVDLGPLDGPRDTPTGTDGPTLDMGSDAPWPDGASPDRPITEDTLAPDTLAPDTLAPDLVPSCPPQCLLGCSGDTATCRTFVPSNIGSHDGASCGDRSWNNTTINTTSCRVGSCSGQLKLGYCVIAAGSLTVRNTVSVEGRYPLILLASGDVTISGGALIDASASGATPGPGGHAGGEPAPSAPPEIGEGPGGGQHCPCATLGDDCGGGGGGFGRSGGQGGREGTSCAVAPGGVTNGRAALKPLVGGSGGASGHNNPSNTAIGSGGGGGGAVQISAQGVFRLDGTITVGGGGGAGGRNNGGAAAAGGGGGSGGAILLEAARIVGVGTLAANGGGGGGGGESGFAENGEDAHPNGAVAMGGQGRGGGGRGGNGGVGTAGQAGEDCADFAGGGGGGGGGSGRIRLNAHLTISSSIRRHGVTSRGLVPLR